MAYAIQMTGYGPPEVLQWQKIPEPEPQAGEALVEVVATGVNRADLEIRSGHWPVAGDPFPYVLGLEACGVVRAVGPGVNLPIGTPVITMMQKMSGIHGLRPGGYQTHLVCPADVLATLDPKTPLQEFAAVGLVGVTAYHGLQRLQLKPKERLAIMGAAGGVGQMAVAIAKSVGCHVIGVTHKKSQLGVLEELGVDEIWDTSERALKDHNPIDACLEMVGGATFGHCVGLLKWGGRLCSIGAITGGPAELSVWHLLNELTLTGWTSENLTRGELQQAVELLQKLIGSKQLQPPPFQERPMAEAARVHHEMEAGELFGRVLLVP